MEKLKYTPLYIVIEERIQDGEASFEDAYVYKTKEERDKAYDTLTLFNTLSYRYSKYDTIIR